MWTFRPAATVEDDLRVKLRASRRQLRASEFVLKKVSEARDEVIKRADKAAEREKDLLRAAAERDNRIEELETVIRLREEEIKGLTGIIGRDRQRVEAETAIEVARAETAARRIQGEQRHQHGFLP